MAALSQAGVKLLWQHDAAQVIGSWLSIAEDSRGLFVRGQLNLDVAKAREVYALMKEGAVDGLSIGFRTQKSVTDPATGVRRLQKVDLWEISIVTFPMLPNARVSSVKYLDAKARLAAAIERGTTQIAAQNARRAMDVRLSRAIERGTQLMTLYGLKRLNAHQSRYDLAYYRFAKAAEDFALDDPGLSVPSDVLSSLAGTLGDIVGVMDPSSLLNDQGAENGFIDTGSVIGTAPDGTPIDDGVFHEGDGANVDLAASTTSPRYAARMLGYDYNTFSDMIHDFKDFHGISPNGNLTWYDDGSTYYNGSYVDNFHNFAP